MTEPKQVNLHPAQLAFRRDNTLYRALCGGIGSGKSWAGAYDMVCRAKPGRLYLVSAPTYSMLADATFRTVLSIAEGLDIVHPDNVKRSAPQSIRLRTGAEVLFRSADEPDRMRGPNLSGIWLDEASLMPLDAFNISIGRLREGGEQGWLTATFTPKGRQHWTYETFATGRPNTAIFHARTCDNPFLPAEFYGNVRAQYSSHLAAQELEGLFVDQAGAMFNRRWFPIVERIPPMVALVRAWDLAATATEQGKAGDPDYSAGVLIGKDSANTYYILDVRRLRGSPQQVQSLVRATAEQDRALAMRQQKNVSIWMEQEPGSAGVWLIDHYCRNVLAGFPFRGERSTGCKADRAQPLAALAEGSAVKLLRGPWNKDFLDEAEMFPFGGHDDQVDAASLAFAKLASILPFVTAAHVPSPPRQSWQQKLIDRSQHRPRTGPSRNIFGR